MPLCGGLVADRVSSESSEQKAPKPLDRRVDILMSGGRGETKLLCDCGGCRACLLSRLWLARRRTNQCNTQHRSAQLRAVVPCVLQDLPKGQGVRRLMHCQAPHLPQATRLRLQRCSRYAGADSTRHSSTAWSQDTERRGSMNEGQRRFVGFGGGVACVCAAQPETRISAELLQTSRVALVQAWAFFFRRKSLPMNGRFSFSKAAIVRRFSSRAAVTIARPESSFRA